MENDARLTLMDVVRRVPRALGVLSDSAEPEEIEQLLRQDHQQKRLKIASEYIDTGVSIDTLLTALIADSAQTDPQIAAQQPIVAQKAAEKTLRSGFSVVVDATFLKQTPRAACQSLARRMNITWGITDCEHNIDVLRDRITARRAAGTDASDSDPTVLEHQINTQEPLAPLEHRSVVTNLSETPCRISRQAIFAGISILCFRGNAGPLSDKNQRLE